LLVEYQFDVICDLVNYPPFTLSRNIPEHLNVTTFLGGSIISSPVTGFRPFRSRLSLTQNFPNPLTIMSWSDGRIELGEFEKRGQIDH
jgi:hypothetical protein